MVDANTDFYKYVDNFANFSRVGWKCVSGNEGLLSKVFVTISIPTYNRPDTLKDAIDSALNQEGYDDYCVMVVDNDPSDGTETEELINSYHSEKLLYFKNDENTGMFGNQNRCFEIPKSEYVLMLHDDDLILPHYLKTWIRLIKENDIDCLQPAKIKWFEDQCTRDKLEIPYSGKKKLTRVYDIENYLAFIPGTQSGGIFRRSSILAVGGYNSDYYPTSDYCIGIQLMEKFRFYTYSEVLSIYRVGHNASMKQETLELFIINDYYVRCQIFKKIGLTGVAKRIILDYVVHRQVETLRNRYNKEFVFDFTRLGIFSDPHKIVYIPYRLYSLVLVKLSVLRRRV